MKELMIETEGRHFYTWDLAGVNCDHDYQFVVKLESIDSKMGYFIFRELYQCSRCKQIGVLEERKKIGTIWW